MELKYKDKTITIFECQSFFSRLRGFMFKKNIDYALLFDNCNSIHTFFMKSNIDVIMCDSNNRIIKYYKNLGRNKVIMPVKNVKKTIELPVNYFDIEIDNYIELKK